MRLTLTWDVLKLFRRATFYKTRIPINFNMGCFEISQWLGGW